MGGYVLIVLVGIILCSEWPVYAKIYSTEAIPEDYLNTACGRTLGGSGASGRLESSHALTYDNQMDCWATIAVTAGRKTLLHVNRFELEEKLAGTCVDYVNIHDGSSTAAPPLNSQPLCGSSDAFNMTASGDKVTIHMVTDNNAVFRGFEVLYVAVTQAPCDSAQFACKSGYCIESKLECNRVNECGDWSDEVGCQEESTVEDPGFTLGLIIGCSVGGLILLIIAGIVIWKLYDYYQFQKWLRYQGLYQTGNYDRAYPVSDKYSRYQEKISGRRDPAPDWVETERTERERTEHAQTNVTTTGEEVAVVQRSASIEEGTSANYGTVNPSFTADA